MSLGGRVIRGALAISIALASFGLYAVSASASSQTYTVGVDNAGPSGHNFEFLDFYPRNSLSVHQGDVVGFNLNLGSADAFHTATLGRPGESSAQIEANNPIFVPDFDDGPNQIQFALTTVFLPSNFGCGSAANPCPYTGSSEINSGALCNPGCLNTEYFYRIALPQPPSSPVTVNFVCLIHGPFMGGSFRIVPNAQSASTAKQVAMASAKQFKGQIAAGLEAEERANEAAESNENGVRTLTLTAGTESTDGRTQVLEMLPSNFRPEREDASGPLQIRWRTIGPNEVHTVTFPEGSGSAAVDPLPFLCEGTPDTPATGGPPFFGCAPPGLPGGLENHLVPGPQGATAITSATTVGSSGVISAGPFGFPSSAMFSFPNPGTFMYQCRIHNHMHGTIVVAAREGGGD